MFVKHHHYPPLQCASTIIVIVILHAASLAMFVKHYHKVDRCLARYSPRAEANNAIPCNTVRYDMKTMRYHIRYKAIPCSTIQCHAIQ